MDSPAFIDQHHATVPARERAEERLDHAAHAAENYERALEWLHGSDDAAAHDAFGALLRAAAQEPVARP